MSCIPFEMSCEEAETMFDEMFPDFCGAGDYDDEEPQSICCCPCGCGAVVDRDGGRCPMCEEGCGPRGAW